MGGLHRKAKTARNALKAQQKRGKNDDNLFSSRSGSKKKSNKNSSQNKPTSSASRNGPVRKDELDEEDFQDRQTNWTLAALQDKIKRDPLAYELEFQAQHRHFEAVLETLLLSPQKPAKDFDEQLMFLAHCWPMFEKKGEKKGEFAFSLRKLLLEHHVELHPATRKALVQALILLRNRNQYELIEAMGLWFELLAAEDRALRSMVYTHIVRDILRMNEKSKDQTENRSLQAYFFEQLVCGSGGAALAKGGGGKKHDGSVKGADATTGGGGKTPKTAFNANHATARKALVILISLYKKNVWTTPAVVNQIALCCEHPDAATAKAAIHFLLGNHHLVGENEDEDETKKTYKEKGKVMGEVSKKLEHLKRFTMGNKKKKLRKVKKQSLKKMDRDNNALDKKNNAEGKAAFAAIDVVTDPQKLAERLLVRVMRNSEPYKFRLLCLQLCSRLMGRHELILLNFYPYVIKYLTVSQREVTVIMAALAQSCHSLLPPDEIRPVVTHILQNFVTETVAPEAITVGVNCLREIACRCPLALAGEQIQNICDNFARYKHRGVRMGVRSLVNMYRELNPTMLHKNFRGKAASEAMARGEFEGSGINEFGAGRELNFFAQGVEMLADRKLRKVERRESQAASSVGGLEDLEGLLSEEDEGINGVVDSFAPDALFVGDEESVGGEGSGEGKDGAENPGAKKDGEDESGSSDLDVSDAEEEEEVSPEPAGSSDAGSDGGEEMPSDLDEEEEDSDLDDLDIDAALAGLDGADDEEASDEDAPDSEDEDGPDSDDEAYGAPAAPAAPTDEAVRAAQAVTQNTTKRSKASVQKERLQKAQLQKLEEQHRKKRVADEAQKLLSETVLSTDDFKKMRRLQEIKAMELQNGRRKNDDDNLSATSSESEDECLSDSDNDLALDEAAKIKKEMRKATKQVYNDLDFIDPDKLAGWQKKRHDKFSRLQSVKKGRDPDQKFGAAGKKGQKTGGSSNQEKLRSKPMLMSIKGRGVRMKTSNVKATQKMANLRGHIKTMGKNKNHQRRRK